MKIELISYPRTGSNWLSYCINFVCSVPTINPCFYPTENELFSTGKNNVVQKSHTQSPEWFRDVNKSFVCVIRNYKECIPRQTKSYSADSIINSLLGVVPTNNHVFDFITTLRVYDECKNPKILFYYEDLIVNLDKELKRLVDFFKQFGGSDNLETFLENIKYHKKKSLDSYKQGSKSGGNKTIHHSLSISNQDKVKIDKHVKTAFPDLFEKYLKRYEEE